MTLSAITLTAQTITQNQVFLTTHDAPWIISIEGKNLDIRNIRLKPGGKSAYFLMSEESEKLNVSIYIEPAEKCKTSEECRDFVLSSGNPMWGKFQNLSKSSIGEFSYFEFFRPEVEGMPVKMQDMYAQYVANGYWVDLHISKVLYKKEDKKLFEDLVKSVKFIPKPNKASGGLSSPYKEIAEGWLKLWDEGKCQETYNALSSFSREAVSGDLWVKHCNKQRSDMGRIKSRNLIGISLIRSLQSKPEHSGATLHFESTLEGDRAIPEYITLTEEKNKNWTVSNYLIR